MLPMLVSPLQRASARRAFLNKLVLSRKRGLRRFFSETQKAEGHERQARGLALVLSSSALLEFSTRALG